MTDPTNVINDVEEDRQHRVAEFVADGGPDWGRGYQPGTVGCHELLDRTALVSSLLDRELIEHPACVSNPDWYALARRASEALADLYQAVGAVHLTADEPES